MVLPDYTSIINQDCIPEKRDPVPSEDTRHRNLRETRTLGSKDLMWVQDPIRTKDPCENTRSFED